MKSISTSLLLAMVLASSMALAQKDTTGWGRHSRFNRMYDPQTVTEVNGIITKIETISPIRGMSAGIHLVLDSEGDQISIHVGPKRYVDNQAIKLNEGDSVRIRGSKITFEGAPAIIAMEITKENNVLRLRDKNGIPLWSGRRRR